MNNTLLWIVLAVGVVIVGIVFFLSSSPPTSGPAPETLIPDAMEGFILVTKEARIEPAFPGEAYSSHAFYTPAPGSPWSGKIDRLGITIFKFKDPAKIADARALLLQGAQTETLDLDGRTAELALEPDGAGLFWQDRELLIAIFASAPAEDTPDLEALKSAALAAGRAVLARATR